MEQISREPFYVQTPVERTTIKIWKIVTRRDGEIVRTQFETDNRDPVIETDAPTGEYEIHTKHGNLVAYRVEKKT
jgi:hypothetical protein